MQGDEDAREDAADGPSAPCEDSTGLYAATACARSPSASPSSRKRTCSSTELEEPATVQVARTHATINDEQAENVAGDALGTADDAFATASAEYTSLLEKQLQETVKELHGLRAQIHALEQARSAAATQAQEARAFQMAVTKELSEVREALSSSESTVRGLTKINEERGAAVAAMQKTMQTQNARNRALQAEVDEKRATSHSAGQQRVKISKEKWAAWKQANQPVILGADLALVTSYEDKDLLNSLGADFRQGKWYVPHGTSLRPFAFWLPPVHSSLPSTSTSAPPYRK